MVASKIVILLLKISSAGADPGYVEVGFRCVKEEAYFADLISFILNIP